MNLTEHSWQSSIVKVMVGNELISETSLSPCMTCIVFDEWKQISIPNGLRAGDASLFMASLFRLNHNSNRQLNSSEWAIYSDDSATSADVRLMVTIFTGCWARARADLPLVPSLLHSHSVSSRGQAGYGTSIRRPLAAGAGRELRQLRKTRRGDFSA